MINNLLQNKITENDRYIFEKLINQSLRKITDYCYGYNYDNCWGEDDCYHCTVIFFIMMKKEEEWQFSVHAKYLIEEENLVISHPVDIVGLNELVTIYYELYFLFRE